MNGIIRRGDKLLAEIRNFEWETVDDAYATFQISAGSYGDLFDNGFHIYLEDGYVNLFYIERGISTPNKVRVFRTLTADEIISAQPFLSFGGCSINKVFQKYPVKVLNCNVLNEHSETSLKV